MQILKERIKNAQNGVETLEMLDKYINDYPMGEPLTGYEFDFAATLIKEEEFVITENGYKVGFVKGRSFAYFIYYKEIPSLYEKISGIDRNFLIHQCNTLLFIINIQEFSKRILHFFENINDSITSEGLNTLICNYLTLVYGSVENYQKKKQELRERYEEKIGKESGE